MKRRTTRRVGSIAFERSYRTALGEHVKATSGSGAVDGIGLRALSLGVETLSLARIHDRATAALAPASETRERTSRFTAREESFFAQVVAPIEAAHSGAPEAVAASAKLGALLDRRTAELATARVRLAGEAERRRALQAKLDASEREHGVCVEALRAKLDTTEREHGAVIDRSRLMEARLRRLSHQLLSAQEEERLRISRDLHDAIGQTLTGINVGLATLKNDAAADSIALAETISLTQHLVERSMKTVHQFAWELRPTLLDDLGLVPALRSYAKTFSIRTGVKVRFSAEGEFDGLDRDSSTALYRVAQGALSNVERHAHAERAQLVVRSLPGTVRVEVRDDGRCFDVERMETSKTNKHLGLLVMRERVEMVGGSFSIQSSPGRGTTVRADVPLEGVTRD